MAVTFTLRPCWGLTQYVTSGAYENVKRHRPDLTDYMLEILSRSFLIRANYLSPITSYLAAGAEPYTGEEKVKRITAEYMKYTVTPDWKFPHGHTWLCNFVEQTVEESYTTKGGHCIVQACNMAAVFDLMGIDYYWLEEYSDVAHMIALYDFAFVHKYWEHLSSSPELVMDSQDYEEYAEIGAVYTPLSIEERVRTCIKEIESEAKILREQGHIAESEKI